MWFNKRFLASTAVVAVSVAGSILQATEAGGAVAAAHAQVTVGSKTYKFSGGQCPTIINSSQDDFGFGQSPNGLEIIGKVHGGKFTNIHIVFVKGSYSTALEKNSGTLNAEGGTFKGTDVYGKKVRATFTC